jgi:tripartite-type tricarboxylate transporter receptor subunit TctC
MRRAVTIPASAVCACAAALLVTAPALAQLAYPVKPVRLIVPLAPGGPSDTLARTLALKLTEVIGQSVVVENRAGAGGVVGTEIAAKSPPDGYTMILVSNSFTINASLYPRLPYDTLKDLAPVTILAVGPYLIAVHPSLPVKSMKELIALAKARPGQLNYASGGSGTGPHMSLELLKLGAGVDIVHIPYKGAGPALIDLMAGHVQVQPVNILVGLPQARAGKLRALAVTTAKRSAAAPEFPTIAETVVPGFDEGGQHGILLPAGVPRDIVARLHQGIIKVLQNPEVRDRLAAEGSEVVGNTPEQYGVIIRADVEKWARVIQRTGIRAN